MGWQYPETPHTLSFYEWDIRYSPSAYTTDYDVFGNPRVGHYWLWTPVNLTGLVPPETVEVEIAAKIIISESVSWLALWAHLAPPGKAVSRLSTDYQLRAVGPDGKPYPNNPPNGYWANDPNYYNATFQTYTEKGSIRDWQTAKCKVLDSRIVIGGGWRIDPVGSASGVAMGFYLEGWMTP